MFINIKIGLLIISLNGIWTMQQHHQQHHLKRRSPLDIRPSFSNLPKYLIPHHISSIYTSIPHAHSQLIASHIQIIDKKRKENVIYVPQHIITQGLPQATSNVHHSSVHTGIKHVVNSNNVKVPVLTQTVSHSSTNITHPSKANPYLVPFHPNHFSQPQQKPSMLVPDLSVLPLQRSVIKNNVQKKAERHIENYEDVYGGRFRRVFGGFGNGLAFGGQGSGHGYYTYQHGY